MRPPFFCFFCPRTRATLTSYGLLAIHRKQSHMETPPAIVAISDDPTAARLRPARAANVIFTPRSNQKICWCWLELGVEGEKMQMFQHLGRLFSNGTLLATFVPYFKLCVVFRFGRHQTSQLSTHEGMHPMRTFGASSLLLSFARRSNALFQNFGRTSGTIIIGQPRTWCAKAAAGSLSMVTDNMTAAAGPGAAGVGHEAATMCRTSATLPLGLDPEQCKVAEIREQIRRRCEKMRRLRMIFLEQTQ